MYSHIYIFGKGSTSLDCARLLQRHNIKACFIEYNPDGVSFTRNTLLSLGIPHLPFRTEILSEIASHKRSLVISISNRFIFPKSFVRCANVDIINYHNSLLPRYRGMHAEAWAISEGEKETGITWHKVDDGIDSGPILVQQRVPIDDTTTSLSLLKQQSRAAVDAFGNMLPQLLNGTLASLEQDQHAKTEVHLGKERPNNGELEPHWPEDKIWRFLRAFDYGCVHTLGQPQVFWQGRPFTWKKYKRVFPCEREESHIIEKNTLVLKGKFLLYGIHQLR